MRKLMSKKGFTLVELMIVVVIMGILVAVAVPVYGAVTKNARIKTCKANQRVIKANASEFYMQGNGGEPLAISSGSTWDLMSSTPAGFMNLFDKGELPTCPSADKTSTDASYTIKIVNTAGAISYDIACAVAAGVTEGHNG